MSSATELLTLGPEGCRISMVIREGANCLEIVAAEQVPDHLPTPGDTRFTVEVVAGNFAGKGSTWIDADQLARFVADLRALEANRSGSAEVESMSPGEFRLRVGATDHAGHMAVAGRLSGVGQSIEFGFTFCPSLLSGFVSEFKASAQNRA